MLKNSNNFQSDISSLRGLVLQWLNEMDSRTNVRTLAVTKEDLGPASVGTDIGSS
jgi:hypothetical protein